MYFRLFIWVGCLVSASAFAQTYKCKNANGTIEISDQPCRGNATTARVVGKEVISEEQFRSSYEWMDRAMEESNRRAQIEAAQQREAQRQEAARQAAYQDEMRRRREAADRQRLLDEVSAARAEAAAAAASAERANAAAAAAAAEESRKNRGPVNCKIRGGGWATCN